MGLLGLNPEYVLHQLTLDEYILIYDGWILKYQNKWEHTRLSCYHAYLASPNRKDNKSLCAFMPFEWDKKEVQPEVRRSTKEEFEALKSLVQQIKN